MISIRFSRTPESAELSSEQYSSCISERIMVPMRQANHSLINQIFNATFSCQESQDFLIDDLVVISDSQDDTETVDNIEQFVDKFGRNPESDCLLIRPIKSSLAVVAGAEQHASDDWISCLNALEINGWRFLAIGYFSGLVKIFKVCSGVSASGNSLNLEFQACVVIGDHQGNMKKNSIISNSNFNAPNNQNSPLSKSNKMSKRSGTSLKKPASSASKTRTSRRKQLRSNSHHLSSVPAVVSIQLGIRRFEGCKDKALQSLTMVECMALNRNGVFCRWLRQVPPSSDGVDDVDNYTATNPTDASNTMGWKSDRQEFILPTSGITQEKNFKQFEMFKLKYSDSNFDNCLLYAVGSELMLLTSAIDLGISEHNNAFIAQWNINTFINSPRSCAIVKFKYFSHLGLVAFTTMDADCHLVGLTLADSQNSSPEGPYQRLYRFQLLKSLKLGTLGLDIDIKSFDSSSTNSRKAMMVLAHTDRLSLWLMDATGADLKNISITLQSQLSKPHGTGFWVSHVQLINPADYGKQSAVNMDGDVEWRILSCGYDGSVRLFLVLSPESAAKGNIPKVNLNSDKSRGSFKILQSWKKSLSSINRNASLPEKLFGLGYVPRYGNSNVPNVFAGGEMGRVYILNTESIH